MIGPGLVGIEAKTGRELWSYPRAASGNMPCAPIVRGDYVFLLYGCYVGSMLLKLTAKPGGGVAAKEVYFLEPTNLQTNSGGPVLVEDYVYGSHVPFGRPQCVELLTGKLMWEKGRGSNKRPAAGTRVSTAGRVGTVTNEYGPIVKRRADCKVN